MLGENISTHYCFFKRVQQSDYTDLEEYGYNRAKQDLQEENLRNYGIQTVFVDEYDEITEILRDLEKNYKMKKVFISGCADAFSDP